GTAWKVQPRRNDRDFEDIPELPLKKEAVPPKPPKPDEKWDVAQLVHKAKATEPAAAVDLLLNTFLQGGVGAAVRDKLVAYLGEGNPKGDALDWRLRETAHAILTLPEYQLA